MEKSEFIDRNQSLMIFWILLCPQVDLCFQLQINWLVICLTYRIKRIKIIEEHT